MSSIQRLQRQVEGKQKEWDVVHDKLTALRTDYRLETDTAVKVKLERQIKDSENDLKAIEQELEQLENQLAQAKSNSSAVPLPEVKAVEILEPPLTQKIQTFEFETATVSLQSGKLVINPSIGRAEFFTEDLGDGILLEMVQIPGGRFYMGSPERELERRESESPQHLVRVKSCFMGKYLITQEQWFAVANLPKIERDLNFDPAYFKGLNRPVERVSWHDAVEFCKRLSRFSQEKGQGYQYRLPSEAEWEYACRAISPLTKGGQGGYYPPFYFGETITTDLANYDGNYIYGSGIEGQYRQQTTDVGSFPANAFGLYDMHGNVYEWCEDDWHSNYEDAPTDGSAWLSRDKSSIKVVRGGSWCDLPGGCRSAIRDFSNPGYDGDDLGLRVVWGLPRT